MSLLTLLNYSGSQDVSPSGIPSLEQFDAPVLPFPTIEARYNGFADATALTTGNAATYGDTAPILVANNGGTIEIDTDATIEGSGCLRFVQAATGACSITYNASASDFTAISFRFYVKISGLPSADANFPCRVQTSAGASVFQILTRTTGFLRIQDGGSGLVTATGTALAAGTYRVEVQASNLGSSTATAVALQVYDSSGAQVQSASSTALNTTAAGRRVTLGKTSTATLGEWSIDAFKAVAGNTTPIGPAAFPPAVATGEAFGSPTVTSTGGGSQSVSPSAIASGEAHGSATITTTVAPSGIASGEAHGSATITATAAITPSGIASGQAFGAPTLTAGAVTVSPSSVGSAEAHGSATVTAAGASVAPSGIATGEAHGSATLTTGAVTASPTGIASGEAHGSATLTTGAVSASLTGIASGEAFGTAAVTSGSATLSPSGVSTAEAFGAATVAAGAATVSPSGIASPAAFGSPTLTPGATTVSPSGIASGAAFGPVAVALAQTSPGIVGTPAETAWDTDVASKTLTLAWAAGHRILILAATSDDDAEVATPVLSGLTFSPIAAAIDTPGAPWMRGWEAVAASSGSGDVALSKTGLTAAHWGAIGYVISGSSGIGTVVTSASSGPTASLTASGDHSLVIGMVAGETGTEPGGGFGLAPFGTGPFGQ